MPYAKLLKDEVLNYLWHIRCKSTVADIITEHCHVHTLECIDGQLRDYYCCNELSKVLAPELFREVWRNCAVYRV